MQGTCKSVSTGMDMGQQPKLFLVYTQSIQNQTRTESREKIHRIKKFIAIYSHSLSGVIMLRDWSLFISSGGLAKMGGRGCQRKKYKFSDFFNGDGVGS